MSVTTTGVKGYEYQYCATAYVALLYLHTATSLFVEQLNGEDATINMTVDGRKQTIDIQVKSTGKTVTIDNLAEWLCHFESRTHTANLLDKISQ